MDLDPIILKMPKRPLDRPAMSDLMRMLARDPEEIRDEVAKEIARRKKDAFVIRMFAKTA
jgi:hypothetical protein